MNHDPKAVAHAASDAAEPVPTSPARRARKLDPAARDRIARGLRLLYAEALMQPVPDTLEGLVADLAARLEDSR
ncbi:NepR family anti-sigma factor [Methylobacterium symbioticum]|nr:NepR family anti-sigma factor [Methylobacterium symbioticum]